MLVQTASSPAFLRRITQSAFAASGAPRQHFAILLLTLSLGLFLAIEVRNPYPPFTLTSRVTVRTLHHFDNEVGGGGRLHLEALVALNLGSKGGLQLSDI